VSVTFFKLNLLLQCFVSLLCYILDTQVPLSTNSLIMSRVEKINRVSVYDIRCTRTSISNNELDSVALKI